MATNILKIIFGEHELKRILNDLYINEKKSIKDIEELFKSKYDIEANWNIFYALMKEFEIPMRTISEAVSLATRSLNYEENILENNPIAKQVIDGLLISDGWIANQEKELCHRFSFGSAQKEFVEYCREKLLCFNPSEINKTESSFCSARGYEKEFWSFSTANHPDITKQRIRWYVNGIKIIPRDLIITPLVLRLWYYGDGSIVNNRENNSCVVRLSTDGFAREDVEFAIEQLKIQANIECAITGDGRIRVNSDCISNFFNYIGFKSDLQCYCYKFDVDPWRFLKPMKQVAKEINIPYNRLSHLVKTKSIEYSRSPGGKKVFFSEDQISKLKQLHSSGLLESDARKNSASVTKGSFKKDPDIEKQIKNVFKSGFPHIQLTEADKIIYFNRLNNIPSISINDNKIEASYRDNDLAINYHPHLFDVKFKDFLTPIEAFNDKEILSNIVENMIKNNVELSNKGLRSAICQANKVKRASQFPIRVAKTLYTLYGKDNMTVLDPCAGFSSRLIGFYTGARKGKYVGIEPDTKTYMGLLNTIKEIGPMATGHEAIIYNDMAEKLMPTLNEQFDFIFTSPPYFNLEKYSEEETQSYNKYPDYNIWLDKFLFILIKESHRLLKDDGIFLLNIANCGNKKIIEHAEIFIKTLFRIEKVLLMLSPSKISEGFAEPIFILRKK